MGFFHGRIIEEKGDLILGFCSSGLVVERFSLSLASTGLNCPSLNSFTSSTRTRASGFTRILFSLWGWLLPHPYSQYWLEGKSAPALDPNSQRMAIHLLVCCCPQPTCSSQSACPHFHTISELMNMNWLSNLRLPSCPMLFLKRWEAKHPV